MRVLEKKGRTVEEAVKLALAEMQATMDDVEVEVLEEPTKGWLRVLGKKDALVRVRWKNTPDRVAKRKLESVLRAMRIECQVEKVEYADGVVRVNVVGKDVGLLIGRKGETLNALQLLLGLMVNKEADDRVRVVVDVEDYRRRKEENLKNLALRISERVKRTRRSIVLRPMSSQERRIIHTALQGDPQIITFSQGEEPNRKVVISLKK